MQKLLLILVSCFYLTNIISAQEALYKKTNNKITLTQAGANHLAKLPLKCIETPYPYKSGVVIVDSSWIKEPIEFHPVFYGCFDWHSSVHGHWMLIKLMKQFPDLSEKRRIVDVLNRHFTKSNMDKELALFSTPLNGSFERPYGWAWLLQLQNELLTWNNADAKKWASTIQPLADSIEVFTINFLKKIVYPIRGGTHSNLAFGLNMMLDYAKKQNRQNLIQSIKKSAIQFFYNDRLCPLNWEPSGTDFLSPCFEEANLMSKVLSPTEFNIWIKKFLPQLFKPDFTLAPGTVKDRTDGQLVHLDGLNFSRAWCLKNIAAITKNNHLIDIANKHIEAAIPHVASNDYMGEHWLASFAVHAIY